MQIEDGVFTLKKKHQYYGQVQLGMAVLNLKQCDLVLYAPFDDTSFTICIEYDEEYTINMLKTIQCNYFTKMIHIICN